MAAARIDSVATPSVLQPGSVPDGVSDELGGIDPPVPDTSGGKKEAFHLSVNLEHVGIHSLQLFAVSVTV